MSCCPFFMDEEQEILSAKNREKRRMKLKYRMCSSFTKSIILQIWLNLA